VIGFEQFANKESRQMKKAYQIDERKAIDRFRSYLATNPGNIQLVLPLADLAQRMRQGVSQMLFETKRELLMLIIGDEMKWLSQEQGMARWGTGAKLGDHS
jgi:hypothetical protein